MSLLKAFINIYLLSLFVVHVFSISLFHNFLISPTVVTYIVDVLFSPQSSFEIHLSSRRLSTVFISFYFIIDSPNYLF